MAGRKTATKEQSKMDRKGYAEYRKPGTRWWLSFCDPDRPAGSQFLGVAIVEVSGLLDNIMGASVAARANGCNPGGEVQGGPLPRHLFVPPELMNRLLTRSEAEALDGSWRN